MKSKAKYQDLARELQSKQQCIEELVSEKEDKDRQRSELADSFDDARNTMNQRYREMATVSSALSFLFSSSSSSSSSFPRLQVKHGSDAAVVFIFLLRSLLHSLLNSLLHSLLHSLHLPGQCLNEHRARTDKATSGGQSSI